MAKETPQAAPAGFFVADVKYAAAQVRRGAPIFVGMTMLRAFTFVLLSCLMTLTGIGAAAARGHMAADGVICATGAYSIVIAADGLPLFDPDGDPVEAQALPCLDCIFGFAALPSPATTAELTPADASKLDTFPPSVLSARLWRMGGMGRSPPHAA